MAWDEFEFDPRSTQYASLRASDADRDVVHRALAEAYADGRLTREEFDQRSEAVLAARTLADLPPLLADLVPTPVVALRPGDSLRERAALEEEAVARYRAEVREAAWGFISASLICWVIWAVTSGGTGFPWPLFVMLGTGLHALRLMVMRQDQIESQRRKLERRRRKELEGQRRPEGREPRADDQP
jgi:hypothetical protein